MTIFAVTSSELITLVSTFLGGTFVAAFVRVYHARPQRDQIVISSTQNAAEIFRGLNEALYEDLKNTREERDRERRARMEWEDYAGKLEDELREAQMSVPIAERPQ